MAEQRFSVSGLADDALEAALRDMASAVAYPPAGEPGRDIAATVRRRLESPASPALSRWARVLPGRRPMRHSLVLALAALLVLVAIAAAVGLGLPGVRIIVGDPPSPPPTPPAAQSGTASLGSGLGLGTAVPFDDVESLVGFDLLLPADPAVGEPDAAFISRGRVALVWAGGDGLPAGSDGIGLLISQFRGSVDDGYYEKILDSGVTPERVTVDGSRAYWIAGPPHFFVYIDANGDPVDDSHRLVGDTLIWTRGDITLRLESSLGRDGAIMMAESME